jgi:hypothetical protein
MSRLLTLLAVLSITSALTWPAAAQEPAAQPRPMQAQAHDPAECFCRAQGTTFAVGQTACLRTSEGPRIAECGMVLNNTSWRFTQRPCPES